MSRSALVVDDSKSARFALRKYLEGHAYTVDTAESAQDAYRALGEARPDLIFLDHIMPGVDGFEALRQIKANPDTATIPVIICSGNEGEHFVSEARDQGAAAVLQKPPTPQQLLQVLDSVQREHAAAAARAEEASQAARLAEESARVEAEARAAAEAARAQAAKAEEGRKSKITAELQSQLGALRATIAELESRIAAKPAALGELEQQVEHLEQKLLQRIEQLEQELTQARAQLEAGVERAAQLAAERLTQTLLKALGGS